MMTTKAELLTELSDISSVVSDARKKLEDDEHVLLSGIDSRIAETCRSVVDLPPDDALEVRPILSSLLDDLKVFSEELESKVTTMSVEGA
jgi:hypothetical protein